MSRANRINLPPEPKWELPKPEPRGRVAKGAAGKGDLRQPVVGITGVILRHSLSVDDIRGTGFSGRVDALVKEGEEETKKDRKANCKVKGEGMSKTGGGKQGGGEIGE